MSPKKKGLVFLVIGLDPSDGSAVPDWMDCNRWCRNSDFNLVYFGEAKTGYSQVVNKEPAELEDDEDES